MLYKIIPLELISRLIILFVFSFTPVFLNPMFKSINKCMSH